MRELLIFWSASCLLVYTLAACSPEGALHHKQGLSISAPEHNLYCTADFCASSLAELRSIIDYETAVCTKAGGCND